MSLPQLPSYSDVIPPLFPLKKNLGFPEDDPLKQQLGLKTSFNQPMFPAMSQKMGQDPNSPQAPQPPGAPSGQGQPSGVPTAPQSPLGAAIPPALGIYAGSQVPWGNVGNTLQSGWDKITGMFGGGGSGTGGQIPGVGTDPSGAIPGLGFSDALSAAAIAHGGYNTVANFGDTSTGQGALNAAEIGLGSAPYLGPYAAIPAALAFMASFFHDSGKPDSQKRREAIQTPLQNSGFLTENFGIPLSGGGEWDLKEHPETYQWSVNPNDPRSQELMKITTPIAFILSGGDPQLTKEYGAAFANAAMSNTGTFNGSLKNVLLWLKKLGWTPEQVTQTLNQLGQSTGMNVQPYIQAFMNLTNMDTLPKIPAGPTTSLIPGGTTAYNIGGRPGTSTNPPITMMHLPGK